MEDSIQLFSSHNLNKFFSKVKQGKLRSKRFHGVSRRFKKFFAFLPCENWGEHKKVLHLPLAALAPIFVQPKGEKCLERVGGKCLRKRLLRRLMSCWPSPLTKNKICFKLVPHPNKVKNRLNTVGNYEGGWRSVQLQHKRNKCNSNFPLPGKNWRIDAS